MRSIEEAACLSPWREHTIEASVVCTGLLLCSISIPSILAGLVVFAVVAGVAAVAEVPFGSYLRKLVVASGFALVSILPMAVGIDVVPRLDLTFDRVGFEAAALAGARAVTTLSVTLLLVHTTPFPRLLALLGRLRFPEILLELLALVHREIFLLDETFSRLRRAVACRDVGRGAKRTIHSFGFGIAALFVQALRRSERVERGIASRGGEVVGRRWEEPFTVGICQIICAVALPAFLAVWMFRRRLGF
ncbi:MAG: cobalt ECF transporter T component CbiQ [Fibrobacterota bacterium]